MKKLLITIGSLLIMAFVVVLFVNATESKKDTKKAKTEVKKAEAAVSCSATCNHSTGDKTATCDPANCKGTNCDPEKCKTAGCDHTNCKGNCEKAGTETKACDPATCPGHTKEPVVK
ncbi:MAG: hypothetical protein MUO72_18510 [Bacteroidales bacterium]|nr:hypothetical protein [Bacteroidales bacterium]